MKTILLSFKPTVFERVCNGKKVLSIGAISRMEMFVHFFM